MTQHYDRLEKRDTEKEKHERLQGEGWELWQGVNEYEAQAAVVLECIFARLSAPELWRCGSVCRAWRRAAFDSSLWRHLLLPNATPHTLRTFEATKNIEERKEYEWSWRKEYAIESARWERCGRLQVRGPSSAPLLCAALHQNDTYLALVDEDAHVTIWEHGRSKEDNAESEWTVRWNGVASPEWRGVALAQWAPHAPRLLLAGRLALVERYEMLVVHFDDEWCSRVVCRSASGPGGAGCWVDDDTFLSLRLRLLAPGRACTTLWLNAATQETYSEFAGVTTPLLRIYNEGAAHISHILVAEISTEENSSSQTETNNVTEFSSEPSGPYYCALSPQKIVKDKKRRMLIAAGGVAGGARGKAQALLAWPLPPLEMPMLWVDDHLAQRVQQHRLRSRAPEPAPDEEPDEEAVRALCTPPAAACPLHAQIFGIVLHPSGRCVWATTEAGVSCVSLPALTPLLRLPQPAAAPHEPDLPSHYLLPCVDDDYFVTPAGVGSGRVCLWTVRSGRCSTQLHHSAPAIAVFLPRRRARATSAPRRLLVLATDALHIVRSLTGEKSGRARRGSCTPVEVQKCAPCEPAPRPACRERAAAGPRGVRLSCRPPPAGKRPPCAPPTPPRPLTCEYHSNQGKQSKNCAKFTYSGGLKDNCEAQLDRVAMRLAAAERVRRLDYEREVAEQTPPPTPVAAHYRLAGEHECLRATDGRDYIVARPQNNTGYCSSSHDPPSPRPVHLKPTDKCEINRGHHLNPCEHHPRIFLEIDRTTNTQPTTSEKLSDDVIAASSLSPKRPSSTGGLTTRILESFKRSGNNVCPRQSCKSQSSEKRTIRSNNDSWCVNLAPPKTVPIKCQEQSLTERLRQRSSGESAKHCNPQRNWHSKSCNSPSSAVANVADVQEKKNQDKLTSIWHERLKLKEAGQGRVVTTDQKEKKNPNIGAGGLELKIPPNTEGVRVRVSLDFKAIDTDISSKNPVIVDDINRHAVSSCYNIGGSDSWLSIKNLQKKLSGYRKNDAATEVKKHEEYGTCQRPKNAKKTIPEKQPACALHPTNGKPNEKPPSLNTPTLQAPRPQSPCVPPSKQDISRYITDQDFLITH